MLGFSGGSLVERVPIYPVNVLRSGAVLISGAVIGILAANDRVSELW